MLRKAYLQDGDWRGCNVIERLLLRVLHRKRQCVCCWKLQALVGHARHCGASCACRTRGTCLHDCIVNVHFAVVVALASSLASESNNGLGHLVESARSTLQPCLYCLAMSLGCRGIKNVCYKWNRLDSENIAALPVGKPVAIWDRNLWRPEGEHYPRPHGYRSKVRMPT